MAEKQAAPLGEECRRQLFAELHELHHDDLLRFVESIMTDKNKAEELLQAALLNAWLKFDQLRDKNRFFVWMRSICLTLCIRSFRTDIREKKKHLGFYEEFRRHSMQASDSDNPQRKRIKEEQLERISELVRSLPDDCREILELQYFQNLSLKEIAEQLGISKSTAKQRLAKARRILAVRSKSLQDFFEND